MNVSDRFWNKVDKSGDCWLWTASKSRHGYGFFRVEGKLWEAHRWIFIYINHYAPEVVMHICDTPSCVNPDHLRGGTRRDNQTDMRIKGRAKTTNYSDTCPKGHSDWRYKPKKSKKTGGLTYQVRACKVCDRDYRRRKYAEHKAKQKAQG